MPNPSDKRESALETPAPTDYHDRLLTANAQQYRRITNILADALPVISRRVGPLEQDEIREAKAILDMSADTRRVCNHIEGMRADCVEVTASLLDIETDAAQHLLDIYCDCVTSGRFPTDSFARWLRETARFAEAVRGQDH